LPFDVSVSVSANLMLNISDTTRFSGLCLISRDPTGNMKVHSARRLVMSLMMSRDYDVTLVTSQSWKLSRSENRIRINYPRGPFKQTLSYNII